MVGLRTFHWVSMDGGQEDHLLLVILVNIFLTLEYGNMTVFIG